MPGESLNFPIFAEDRASKSFREVGNAALGAAGKVDIAAASLKVFGEQSISSGKAAASSEAAIRSHIKADQLFADAMRVLNGEATKTTRLMTDQQQKLKASGEEAGKTAGLFSALAGMGGGGGAAGGGMGGLIAAGVALSPVIATVGVGLGGLALAALGAGKNSKQLAAEVAPLKADFAAFSKSLEPVVLLDFAKAAGVARIVLHSIEPVAAATGKALGQVLGQVGAEFRSGEFQQFFAWMARQAGPDVRLLGDLFISLMKDLPPLVKELQPLGRGILLAATDALKLVGALEKVHLALPVLGIAIGALVGGPIGALIGGAVGAGLELNNLANRAHVVKGNIGQAGMALEHTAATSGRFGASMGVASGHVAAASSAAKSLSSNVGDAGAAAAVAGPKFFSLNKEVRQLNTSMTKLVGNLLTLQGSELSWKQSLQAAQAQLKSNSAGLEGNSKNALANRAAVLASTQAAVSFAQQELTTGKDISGASRTVQAQIRWLQGLHDKSSFVRAELAALRREERLLQAQQINQTIHVQGLGQWSVSQSLAPGFGHRKAAGGLLRGPGTPVSDSIPVWASTGEYMVKAAAVSKYGVALFDKLNAMQLAGGGLIPSYSGSPAMAGWVRSDDKATIRLIDEAVVKATVAGMRAAQSAAAAIPSGVGGNVMSWIAASLGINRLPGWWASLMAILVGKESGGDPRAENPISVLGQHAEGIAQMLPSTFATWSRGGSIWNPIANLVASERYIANLYGNPRNIPGLLGGNYQGYGFGTRSALPGLAVVGERGPELVSFRGGEKVTPVSGSRAAHFALTEHGDVIIQDATDIELLRQKMDFAIMSASLG